MKKRTLLALSALLLYGCASAPLAIDSDEPEYARDATVPFKAANSHERSVQIWKTPEDINAWIAANFSYDRARAIRLSETQRAKQMPLAIRTPSEFFDAKSGVCVDLARFAVETLKRIDPASDPRYLMIEFDPIQSEGNTLRLHWLVSFKRDGQLYFLLTRSVPDVLPARTATPRHLSVSISNTGGERSLRFASSRRFRSSSERAQSNQHTGHTSAGSWSTGSAARPSTRCGGFWCCHSPQRPARCPSEGAS